MSRFFKFRSAADLAAEAERLGLDIRLRDDLSPLFAATRVGSLTVGNRVCIHPMEGCDGELDGRPGELTFRRYRRFGDGGAKLIWAEATAVVEEGRANPRQILISEDHLADFARIVEETRAAHRAGGWDDGDLVIGIQLTHSGRYSYRKPLLASHDPALDPRTVMDKATGRTATADDPLLSDDDLRRLVDHFVAAARLAFRAGFQFVDVKQCHRYLLNELLSARSRPGPYGGSLENRTRLAREIITAIRATVPDLMLATRINVFDCVPFRTGADGIGEPCPYPAPHPNPWGFSPDDALNPDLNEPLAWIAEMARLGVAVVNVTMGNPYGSPHISRPFEYPPPDGYEPPVHPLIGVDRQFRLTAEVQAANPSLPVVGTGYSYLQEFLPQVAAANVAEQRCTFAGVGRASLSQPDLVRQLLQTGRLDRKRVCRTFSYCTALMRAKHNELGQFATGCPPFDKDIYGPLWKAAQEKP